MPATGHYFLNEGEDPDQNALYEKYRLTSQHGPLLLMLLLLVATACIALVSIIFSEQVSKQPPDAPPQPLIPCSVCGLFPLSRLLKKTSVWFDLLFKSELGVQIIH